MKGVITAGLLFTALPLVAQAGNCTGDTGATKLSAPTTLNGVTVCAHATNGDHWQEWHQGDGTLTEYAKGPSDPIDPTHDVGTWSGAGSDIAYGYTDGGNYTFELWQTTGGNYFFCEAGAGTGLVATVDALPAGQASCGY